LEIKTDILKLSDFENLFKTYFSALTGFSQTFVYDEDAAKEIVQNVYISLWDKREDLDLKQSLKSYLYTSVRNRSLNYLRDHKKFRSQLLDDDLSQIEATEESDPLVNEELQEKINQAINLLPAKCKQVFELSRNEGLKYKQIAEQLDISVKTVENQISKALKILREELKDYAIILIIIGFFE
jgi:RNA polymerase sigma-70 factor (ECF subfamily)